MSLKTKYLLRTVACAAFIVVAITLGSITKRTVAGSQASSTAVLPSEEILIPEGQFLMGCASDIWYKCDLDSQPVHGVYLDAYYIDKTEVTVSQYYECVSAGACTPPDTQSHTTQSIENTTQNNHPVTYVTWDQADTYCQWRGKRLPTEAEWEKAAHGPNPQIYPWGTDTPTCDLLNFNKCVGSVVPVGSYPENASPYGALDMAGNVREWVNDFYEKPYYDSSPYYNPQGPPEEDTVGEHLLRGGSWKDDAGGITTWIRFDESETYYIYKAGIRCARSAPAGTVPTPTLPPTPIPTAMPYAEIEIDKSGGAAWFSSPNHLTLMAVPRDTITETTTITLSHSHRPNAQADLQGNNHFFTVSVEGSDYSGNGAEALFTPLQLVLAYNESGGIISGTMGLYRATASGWITAGITKVLELPGYLVADIGWSGNYGLLGKAERVYLPAVMRQ